ncbi:MAG: hypothetical protein ACRCX8_16250 [Sarcina sp.]
MKKFMIITSLVLAIGASVIAGTMAKYTQTLDEQVSVVKTKSFYINSSSVGEGLKEDFKLAPGEEKIFEYEITNAEKGGEVPSETDIKVIAEIKKEKGNKKEKLFNDLKITIDSDLDFTTENSSHINIQGSDEKKKPDKIESVTAKGEGIFKADKLQTKKLKIKVSWKENSHPNYNNYKDDEVKLSLKLDAVQQ